MGAPSPASRACAAMLPADRPYPARRAAGGASTAASASLKASASNGSPNRHVSMTAPSTRAQIIRARLSPANGAQVCAKNLRARRMIALTSGSRTAVAHSAAASSARCRSQARPERGGQVVGPDAARAREQEGALAALPSRGQEQPLELPFYLSGQLGEGGPLEPFPVPEDPLGFVLPDTRGVRRPRERHRPRAFQHDEPCGYGDQRLPLVPRRDEPSFLNIRTGFSRCHGLILS